MCNNNRRAEYALSREQAAESRVLRALDGIGKEGNGGKKGEQRMSLSLPKAESTNLGTIRRL